MRKSARSTSRRHRGPDAASSTSAGGTPSQASLTVLFTDIKGSVRLFQELGDREARALTREHDRILEEEVERRGGRPIDRAGDSLLAAFHDAEGAVGAALSMQEAIHRWWTGLALGFSFGVRMGLHTGPVLYEGARLAGDTLNLASRTMGQADAHDIVLTESVYGALSEPLREPFAWFGPFHPRGAKGIVGLYRWRAAWRGPSETAGSTIASDLDESGWRLGAVADEYTLSGVSPEVAGVRCRIAGEFATLGRSVECTYRLDPERVGKRIGRMHMGLTVARRQCWVFDLGGNGGVLLTYEAGERPLRVVQRAPVSIGTELRTGMLLWRLEATPAPARP